MSLIAAPPVVINTQSGVPLWVALVTAALTGGVVGTLVSTFISAGRDGREARAKARECLNEVEDTRWADTEYGVFRQRVTQLEAAALIARIPRGIVQRYSYLADMSRRQELAEKAADPDNHVPRTLPLEFASLIGAQVSIFVYYLWHPYPHPFKVKRSMWIIDHGIAELRLKYPQWIWRFELWTYKPIEREPAPRGWLHRTKAFVWYKTRWPQGVTGRKMPS